MATAEPEETIGGLSQSTDLNQVSVKVDSEPTVQVEIAPAADIVFMDSQGPEVIMSTQKLRFESADAC